MKSKKSNVYKTFAITATWGAYTVLTCQLQFVSVGLFLVAMLSTYAIVEAK